ncbi:hypothetical protein BST61_g1117 [Cercospora zeina]
MNGFNSAVLGLFILTAAAFAFIPLTIASPFMLLRPKLLFCIWGVWLFFIAEGSSFLLDVVGLFFTRPRYRLDFHQRPSPSRRAEPASKSLTTPLPTVHEFEPEIPADCMRVDMTPPASVSRANSIKFATPVQDASSPTSRRASTIGMSTTCMICHQKAPVDCRAEDRAELHQLSISGCQIILRSLE